MRMVRTRATRGKARVWVTSGIRRCLQHEAEDRLETPSSEKMARVVLKEGGKLNNQLLADPLG